MELSEKETERIRTFVRDQLGAEPDLSTLTIRILKSRYLAHVQGDTLSPEAKSFMKQVVQDEIMKMKDTDNSGSEGETRKVEKKRKRTNELSDEEDGESVAKKSRQSPSLSESNEKADRITTDEEEEEEEAQSHPASEEEKQVTNKSRRKSRRQETSEESSADERNGAGTEGNGWGSPKEVEENRAGTLKGMGPARRHPSHEKETPERDEDSENGDEVSEKSENTKNDTSSDDSDKEKPSEKKMKGDTDSDSSSLPSLEDEDDKLQGNGQEQEKKKGEGKKKKTEETKKSDKGGQKDNHKSVARLKRFIGLCGVRRNYKKLLHDCRSVRSQVAVLRKELEDLGVHGKPSVERCKKIRMKREEDEELAELDVKNIISTQGRPKRRGASAWQEQQEPSSSTYARALNSDSDSHKENKVNTGRQRTTDWSNLQGIISDDADSD